MAKSHSEWGEEQSKKNAANAVMQTPMARPTPQEQLKINKELRWIDRAIASPDPGAHIRQGHPYWRHSRGDLVCRLLLFGLHRSTSAGASARKIGGQPGAEPGFRAVALSRQLI